MKPTIAIAGATGFIGRWFIHRFHKQYNIIALSRTTVSESTYPEVKWRKADLYSLSSTKEALKGADYAVYLVHSMQPSTRLNQSSFEDTDLLLADNFARSAAECQVKQIVFVGGILPKDPSTFSKHLRSRYETESTLGSTNVPVTSLRAGIVIGPGGSSFEVMKRLVDNLPVMACPEWCQSLSQPVDIEDVLRSIDQTLGNARTFNKAIEIGGIEVITYMELLRKTSAQLGKRRLIFSIPFFTLGFSKLWVALFSGSSRVFVSPLIESLKHDMRVDPDQEYQLEARVPIDESIRKAIHEKGPSFKRTHEKEPEKNTVRSVQRLSNPSNKSATWIADEYPHWLPRFFKLLIRAKIVDQKVQFFMLGIMLLEITYMAERSDEKRRLFFITGGRLAKRTDMGWLEFRSVLDNRYIISAIHRFVPALPWWIYRYSQAVMHLFVMKRYNNYLEDLKS